MLQCSLLLLLKSIEFNQFPLLRRLLNLVLATGLITSRAGIPS